VQIFLLSPCPSSFGCSSCSSAFGSSVGAVSPAFCGPFTSAISLSNRAISSSSSFSFAAIWSLISPRESLNSFVFSFWASAPERLSYASRPICVKTPFIFASSEEISPLMEDSFIFFLASSETAMVPLLALPQTFPKDSLNAIFKTSLSP